MSSLAIGENGGALWKGIGEDTSIVNIAMKTPTTKNFIIF
jgi:hypothetical protein